MKYPQNPLLRDLWLGFLWSIVIALVICAPGVFSRTTHFVYTVF